MRTKSGGYYLNLTIVAYTLLIIAISSIQLYYIIIPNYFHEEHRNLFHYYARQDSTLFANDYITSFVTAFSQPYLYDWLTWLWLWVGGDLIIWHRVLSLVCWLAFLAGVATAAQRFGDRVTMLGVVGIVIVQPIYLYQITSSLPHAFAYPLLIWAIVALVRGAEVFLALLTLLSGLLYPAVTPLIGLLLAWHVFVTQRGLRKQKSYRLRVLLVGVTGAIAVWLIFGTLSGPDNFGAALEPSQRAAVYPENGLDGRHFYGIFYPFKYVVEKAVTQFRTPIGPYAFSILLLYCILALYGFISLRKDNATWSALLGFIVCAVTVCVAIFLLKPFLVYRFVMYPACTILPLLFVAGLQRYCRWLDRFIPYPNTVALILLALFVVTLDSADQKKIGYWWHLGEEPRRVMAFAADQPPDTLFAAWPDPEGELEFIPYVARRPLFVMHKAHYPTYEEHIIAMRGRMHALIAAYLATDVAALRRLHCDWGVDFLIVNKAHFADDDGRPRYFAPFDDQIEKIWKRNRREEFLLRAPNPSSVALETASYFILDLKAVDCNLRQSERVSSLQVRNQNAYSGDDEAGRNSIVMDRQPNQVADHSE